MNAVFLSSQLDELDFHENIIVIVFNIFCVQLCKHLIKKFNYKQEELIYKNSENDLLIKTVCSELSENNINMCIQKVQNQYQKHHNQFVLICNFLYEIVKHFPSEDSEISLFSKSTKYFSDLYVKMCNFCSCSSNQNSKKFTESEQYSSLKKLLMLSSNNTIHEIAASFSRLVCTKVSSNQIDYTTDFLNDLHDFEEILEKLKRTFTFQSDEKNLNDEEGGFLFSVPNEDNFLKKLPANLSRRSSVKPLKTISENSPTKKRYSMMPPTIAETQNANKVSKTKQAINVKQSMIDWLTTQFSNYFECDYATKISYSEFFCYNDIKKLKKRLFDVQRINIHDCLIQSSDYLNLMRFSDETKRNESPRKRLKSLSRRSSPVQELENSCQNLLPINIIYKLYLECGHMINLFDWLQVKRVSISIQHSLRFKTFIILSIKF